MNDYLRGYGYAAREVKYYRSLGWARGKGEIKKMIREQRIWMDRRIWTDLSEFEDGYTDALLDSVGC